MTGENSDASVPITQPEGGPHEEGNERLAFLREMFLELAAVDEDMASKYVRHGGGIRLCLNEMQQLSEPSEYDVRIEQARSDYLQMLLRRPHVRRRNGKHKIDELQATYVDAIMGKVEAVLDAQTNEDALRLFQMPTIIEKTSFVDDQELGLGQLAGNHLYVLADTALKEHVQRRKLIDDYRHRHGLGRVVGNRAVRVALAGGVFAASLSPKMHLFSEYVESEVNNIDLGLQILSGLILALEAPEVVRLGVLDLKHARATNALHDQIASTKQDTDLALRIVYNATRYGGRHEANLVSRRFGTDDKGENLRRFEELDHEFQHLNNDPGGKPYSGEQALGYAARLLIERRQQLLDIVDTNKSANERREAYLTLTREIVEEDLARMRKGLSVNKLRRVV
ncbi:MAG TPA: hypothetical protein VLF87_00275, partial [Patescibacteria group bacterium]|nr:hypothetical protein [Patescibacteria group bacterium]